MYFIIGKVFEILKRGIKFINFDYNVIKFGVNDKNIN